MFLRNSVIFIVWFCSLETIYSFQFPVLRRPSHGNQDFCVLDFDGPTSDLPTYHPIIVDELGEWVIPTRSDSGNSIIEVPSGDFVFFSCEGSGFEHQDIVLTFALARCEFDDVFTLVSEEDLRLSYDQLSCNSYPDDHVVTTGQCGPNNEYTQISIRFFTGMENKQLYRTCFDPDTSTSIWAENLLYDTIGERETGSSGMPDFTPDNFFPEFDVDEGYSKDSQRNVISALLGSDELGDKYVDISGGTVYLARGHLAPKADFIYKNWQRSSYRFINTAPQWQCFNAGNWNFLENAIRSFVEEKPLSPFAVIFTGTHGVMKLDDINGNPTEIWLHLDAGGDRLPVPRFYWKIIFDLQTQLGVALIGVNNPHILEEDVPSFKICPELVNHPLIQKLSKPDDIVRGVTYACSVPDAKRIIFEMPEIEVDGILE